MSSATSEELSFRWLWAGSTLNLYIEQYISFAIPLLLVSRTGTSVELGQFVTFLFFVPYLAFGLNAGVWLEGRSHKRSLILSSAVQAILIALLLIPLLSGSDSPFPYVAFTLAAGTAAVFFQVSFQSILPAIFNERPKLYGANSRLALSDALMRIIGPASAGILVGWLQPGSSTTLVLLLALLGTLAFLPVRSAGPAEANSIKRDVRTRTLLLEGLNFVSSHKWLNPIIFCGAYYIVSVTAIKVTIPLYLVESGKASAAQAGILIAIIAAGYALGSAIGKKMATAIGARTTLQLGAILATIGIAGAAMATTFIDSSAVWVSGVFLALHGVGDGMFAPTALSVRQISTPPDLMARVTAVHRFFIWGGMSLGGLVAAAATFLGGPEIALILTGVCVWGTLPILYRRNFTLTSSGEAHERDPEMALRDAQ
ncbi:MFS transporter [Mycolicibacterium doricum]|uniref:MFS transporter n=1 Tax=Mycolicibacterium doricum TaxID=126673 RepID=UPI0013FD92C8|nr:MFS transporter [Mycolicibacterium doricum]